MSRLGQVIDRPLYSAFPCLNAAHFDEADLLRLAGVMTAKQERRPTRETERDPEEDRKITAAYTYLGQFIDHDLTFDPTSQLRAVPDVRKRSSPGGLPYPPFRPGQPVRARAGRPALHVQAGTGSACCWANACRATPTTQVRARYPAGRVAGRSSAIRATTRTASWRSFTPSSCGSTTGSPSTRAYRPASRRSVSRCAGTTSGCWSPTSCPPSSTTRRSRASSRTLASRHPRLPGLENDVRLMRMPVEFSVAAFRFGHAMVRPLYRLNTTVERRPIFLHGQP